MRQSWIVQGKKSPRWSREKITSRVIDLGKKIYQHNGHLPCKLVGRNLLEYTGYTPLRMYFLHEIGSKLHLDVVAAPKSLEGALVCRPSTPSFALTSREGVHWEAKLNRWQFQVLTPKKQDTTKARQREWLAAGPGFFFAGHGNKLFHLTWKI